MSLEGDCKKPFQLQYLKTWIYDKRLFKICNFEDTILSTMYIQNDVLFFHCWLGFNSYLLWVKLNKNNTFSLD